MIKANNGTVEIDGGFTTLIADFTVIAKAMYEEAGAKLSDDNMKVLLNDCLQACLLYTSQVYADEKLLKTVTEERAGYREMLLRRGRAFEEAAKEVGLETVPFDAGFFISIPCEDPDTISRNLEKEGLFIVPLAKGLRVSVASVGEAACRKIPAMVKAAMDALQCNQ